ncbi:MAG: radical SAM protein [Deltaproteobacteria bacterium]|nr:radical SAM protein [Deltaproteobacteria bacterium]
MHVSLVLTHDCNLACTYCYTGEKFRREMDWETAERSVDLAFRETPPGAPVDVGFFGGEPLLCWDMLVRVGDYARARAEREGRRLRLAVTTNGTLLTRERTDTLARLGVEVTLSLDGTREAHEATRPQKGGRSSFDDVVRGAENLKASGLPLEVIAVVAPGNVRWLGETVRYLVDLGARNVILNPCFEQWWTDEALALWEKGLEDAAEVYSDCMRQGKPVAMPTFDNKLLAAAKGGLASCDMCSAGDREVAVAPSGNLYPCARMVGEDRDTALVIGHLDTGVDRGTVRNIRRGPLDPACEPCAERWRCGATCACSNLAETGTTYLPGGTQCWYEQASARIADAAGLKLLEARNETFLAWTYGRVAAAAELARLAAPQTPSTHVRRVRRLPVVNARA